MTQKQQEQVQQWHDTSARHRLELGSVLTANLAALVWQQWHDPGARWLAYWWLVTVTITAACLWVWRTEQRRHAFGDKAAAWWCWHWFTGAPLVLVNHPELPWWRDLAACFPFLDTDRAEPCLPADVPPFDPGGDARSEAEVAQLTWAARRERWRCLSRRAATGTARTLATAALVLAEYVRSGAPHGLSPRALALWGLGGTAALVLFVLGVTVAAIQAAMYRWWVRPLALALAQWADWPLDKRPASWVKLSRLWENGTRRRWWHAGRLFETRQRGVEIILSPTFKAGNQHTLAETLAQAYAKSGLSPSEVDPLWDTTGEHRSLRLVPAKTIPTVVSFADVRPRRWFLEKATRSAPVWGAVKGWARFQKALDGDAPHVCIAGPTGSGKSELAHSALASLLWANRKVAGTRAEIWDIKVKSHVAFEGLACVDYHRALPDIAMRCIAVATLARDRGAKSAAHERATGKDLAFPPLFIVFEDTAQAMQRMWAHRKDRLLPADGSPTFGDAVLAWDEILGLGRGVNIHAIACPHRPTVRALGGDVARDNFRLVFLMTGHNAGSLRIVDPTLRYEPLPEVPGRARVLHGGQDTVVQALWDQHRQMIPLLADAYGTRPLPDHLGDQTPDTQRQHQPRVAGQPTNGPVHSNSDGGAHDPILTRVRMPEQAQIRRPGDLKPVPAGADRTAGAATSTTTLPPAAGAEGGTDPEAPGVIGAEPQTRSDSADSSPLETHSPSLPRLDVPSGPGEGSPGGGVGAGEDGPLVGGPDEATLREAWERGLVGVGLTYDTVKRARSRTREAIAQFDSPGEAEAAGWWFPPVIDTRPAPGGRREEVCEAAGLVRWWNGRVRAAPEDGEWWVYWMVEGGVGAVSYGAAVKIGYTDDLRVRCRAFGKHWPGADRVGGDIVHLERYPTKAKARAREKQLHDVYRRCHRDPDPYSDPPVPAGTTLMCWPHGGGGRGGRETFYMEGPLAADMARHCPGRAQQLRQMTTTEAP